MNKNNKYTDREWEELAAHLSGERSGQSDLFNRFMAEDLPDTAEQWKGLTIMNDKKEINVDTAWNNLYTRISDSSITEESSPAHVRLIRRTFLRVAAAVLIVIGLGLAGSYIINPDLFSRKISVVTGGDQKNIQVSLSDGSLIYLNRSSELTYRTTFGRKERNVTLTGEGFFEISPDASKPFVIDAGDAKVRVIGTSFNIITRNNQSAVEVFVKTGKVILSDNSGKRSMALDSGYIGTMNPQNSEKTLNKDPNYLAWNTGLLVYNGQKLDVVFRDLNRVYNIDIVADDPGITENRWTSPIDNQPHETIIRLICASFNLRYSRDGNIYHLAKK